MKTKLIDGAFGMLVGVVAILCVAALVTLLGCRPMTAQGPGNTEKEVEPVKLEVVPSAVGDMRDRNVYDFVYDNYRYVVMDQYRGGITVLDKEPLEEYLARKAAEEQKD